MELGVPPLFEALRGRRSVVIAGAGGGFDVYAGLPLALALHAEGVAVQLANLSFVDVPDPTEVTPGTQGPEEYFPERTLSRWLAANHLPPAVWAFPRTGVRPLREAYRALVERVGADAIVLVDGGTDILMRGDESGLGTPEEDMTSLAAVAGLTEVPTRLVTCLGFGIDAYHGVNHSQVLENIAALDRAGAYLGALSIPSGSAEALLYRDAVAHAQRHTPLRPSIVNGQIAAALAGEAGNVRLSYRPANSTLFVNPLMAIYFSFTVAGLAGRSLYLDRLEDTLSIGQVASRIQAFRVEVTPRAARAFPH
ncbi:DUF1152 domain-containing protein [Dactylosporangium salmoneum]|uniref:DUF1152 domain-containing protein n=1 Tax=Dactylosporangium salmoneum TaxID=53361 RepID=A0ABP5UJJ0_9ACTN